MINVQDVRKGNVLKIEGDLWTVMSMQHVTPGKGSAFVKIKARSHKTGNAKEVNYRSGEKIEMVNVFGRPATYSFKEGDDYVFMDTESFEQYHVSAELCEDVEKYVILNGEVTLNILDSTVLSVDVPNFVTLKVEQADAAVKGDTVTKTMKTVELETGHKVLVPLFINEKDMIRIDTRSGEYLDRVKS